MVEDVDILGIDLGTTNSAIARWSLGTADVEVISNHEGEHLTRSVVFIDPVTGDPLVGAPAQDLLVSRPEAVVYSLKRLIGRTGLDQGVGDELRHLTYNVEETERHKLVVHVGEQLLAPPEISAHVLRKLRQDAEEALGRPVRRAVITVPAYFEEPQRQATKEAGWLAGLEVPRIVNEPTAATLAFGLGAEPQTVAVYDLGGGTFDISLVHSANGLFRVMATGGDTKLGGDDFDRMVVGWMHDRFVSAHGTALPEDDAQLAARLREEARRAKEALTGEAAYTFDLPGLVSDDGKRLGLHATLRRETLEELVSPLVERTLTICEQMLEAAGVSAAEVEQVLLVGGQTRAPAVGAAVRERFGWRINDTIDPDEAVARGAAILGARLCGHLVDRVKLWDVTPLSLGIELASGRFEPIIRANQQIPVSVWRRGSKGFTTHRDGQRRIKFLVYQGERPLARDNTKVGEVVLNLATARERGSQRVDCLFKIDQDGILHVRAEEADTDQPAVEVAFDRSYQLTEDEIEAQRQASERHRRDDEVTSRLLDLSEELGRVRRDASGDERIARTEVAIAARDIEGAEALMREIRQETAHD